MAVVGVAGELVGEPVNAFLPPRRDGPTQISVPEGVIQRASELRGGDYVIYPSQGVHRVVGFERMDVAGQQLEVVRLEREHDGAAVVVPVAKVPSTGLRRVAARKLIDDVFHLLGAVRKSVELDWRERHRENVERLMAGGVLGVAEVVKGLHALAQLRPLSPKDRVQYDNARDLLVHEVAASLSVSPGLAEDYIDYALTPPAGVKLMPKPRPKPKRAPWVPRRPERRHPAAEELEGAGATAKAVRGRRAATGERARKPRPKKHAPPKRRVRKAGLAKQRGRKNRAPKRTSRSRR